MGGTSCRGGRVLWPSYGGKVDAGVANCKTGISIIILENGWFFMQKIWE